MATTRRDFMLQGVAASALMGMPGLLHAQMPIGNMTLDVVSDGYLTLPGDFIFGPMPQDELMPVLNRLGQEYDQLTPPCNLSLLRGDGRVVLFDAGSGSEFMLWASRRKTSPIWFSPMGTPTTYGGCWTILAMPCLPTRPIISGRPNGIIGPIRIP